MKSFFSYILSAYLFWAVLVEADKEPYNPRLFTCSLLKYSYEKCMKQAESMCGYDPNCSFSFVGRSNIKTRRGGSDMVMYIEFNQIVY